MAFMDLFRPKWQHSDCNVRQMAVKKLTDQALLYKIANEDKVNAVRKAAVEKLTDQGLLANFAETDPDCSVRRIAVSKLTDQSKLLHFALAHPYDRYEAVQNPNLIDQSALVQIALADQGKCGWRESHAPGSRGSAAALRKITDQSLLAKVAFEVKDPDIMFAATARIIDRALVMQLAIEHRSFKVRAIATAKITDQVTLSKIIGTEKYDDVVIAAIKNSTDKDSLSQVVSEGHRSTSLRCAALKRLGEITDATVTKQFIAALNDDASDIWMLAAAILATRLFQPSAALEQFRLAYRSGAVQTMAKMGDLAVDFLCAPLAGTRRLLTVDNIRLLGMIGGTKAAQRLLEISGLFGCGYGPEHLKAVASALIDVLQNPHRSVERAMLERIANIRDEIDYHSDESAINVGGHMVCSFSEPRHLAKKLCGW
jgi:hypothetical protein